MTLTKEFLENATKVFSTSKQEKLLKDKERNLEKERDDLYRTIGQVTFERDWLKKKLEKLSDQTSKKSMIKNPDEEKYEWLASADSGVLGSKYAKLPISRQCDLLSFPRTSLYRKYVEPDYERERLIKTWLDYWHTKMPYLGCQKLRDKLNSEDELMKKDIHVGRKLVKRYMEEMGIRAIHPKVNTSKPNKKHKKYPYLLRNMNIYLPNQVWAIDITYIRMEHGHMYLTAIIDWYSRYIVGYELSDTLDTAPVLSVVKSAIEKHGVPAIINSDQGSNFTGNEYSGYLKQMRIKQSMDSKGRWVDNVIIERWFRSLKTENIYINEYKTPKELRAGIREYISEYNAIRPHQTFDYLTPEQVYQSKFSMAAA